MSSHATMLRAAATSEIPQLGGLVSETELKNEGAATARIREQLRIMTGGTHPVTPRQLTEASTFVAELVAAKSPFKLLDQNRDRVDSVLCALLAIDAIRARKAWRIEHAEVLEGLWRCIHLMLPQQPLLAELLDVGAYQGGLIDSIRRSKRAEIDYLAIDLDPSNAPSSTSVTKMDATRLDLPNNSISQVYLLDILEHLHGYQQVFDAVAEAVRVARDFVYIECPNFGEVDYLANLGLKWCWSDWTGHPMFVTQQIFQRVCDELCLDDIAEVRLGETVFDTGHEQMVTLAAPRDTTIHMEEIQRWRPEQSQNLDRAIHHRVMIQIRKRPEIEPLWISHHPVSLLTPTRSDRLPTDSPRMAALLTTLLNRESAVSVDEVEAANEFLGRILQGADFEEARAAVKSSRDVSGGLFELFARAAYADGNLELGHDLRAIAKQLLVGTVYERVVHNL